MTAYNLNAARAARAEKAGPPPSVLFGDPEREFILNREIAVEFGELARSEKIRDAIALLLADPADIDAFMACRPTIQDLEELGRNVYGQGMGESSASSGSSTNDGVRSRPTSNVSTDLTSPPAAGVRTESAFAASAR